MKGMLWISSNKYRLFGRRALCTGAAIVALCVGSTDAFAGPDGEIITGGTISISRIDATTTVINQSSDRGIIDWRNFDVNANERVQFNQPTVQSITVNRVKNSTKKSEINGEINEKISR
jgi:large exoprotein involved in heme utilization and adhesion